MFRGESETAHSPREAPMQGITIVRHGNKHFSLVKKSPSGETDFLNKTREVLAIEWLCYFPA